MLSPCVPRCGSCARMLSPCVPHCGNRTVPRCGGGTRRSRRRAGRKETACQARTLGCHAAERRATRCVLRLDEADPLGGKAPAGHVRRAGVVGEVQIKRQRLEKTSRKTLLSVGAVTSQQKKGGLVARHEPTRSSAEEGKGPGRWPTSRLRLSHDIRLRKERRSSLFFGEGRKASFVLVRKALGSADGWPAFGRSTIRKRHAVRREELAGSTDWRRRRQRLSGRSASTRPNDSL